MKIETCLEPVRVIDVVEDVEEVIRDIASDIEQEDAFYVCCLDEIVEKFKIWKKQLPRVQPHYAVKCNDDLTILETLAALGASFDCASKGEIAKVLSIGASVEQIIFANPAKLASHVKFAKSVGLTTMTFDNECELHKIKHLNPDARLVIRIRCDAEDAQCPLGMKFGCDPIKEAPALLKIARCLDLNVVGVSFHVGSGCREPKVFHRAISLCRDIFDYAVSLGYSFSLLDIGGGYPGVRGSSINEIANVVNKALNEFFPDESVQIIAEPGRFFVSSAYTLTCKIYSIRDLVDDDDTNKIKKMYYINDGVYGSFNCILYDHQVVIPKPLKQHKGAKQYFSSIWGPTCDGLDQVVENMILPEMKMGEWIVFEDMGAYTLPVASEFNGFPVPEVHYVATETVWAKLKNIVTVGDRTFKPVDGPIIKNIPVPVSNPSNYESVIELPHYNGNGYNVVAGNHILNYINIS